MESTDPQTLQSIIRDLNAQLAQSHQPVVGQMYAVLKQVEFADGWCPVCNRRSSNYHKPDCTLAAALKLKETK